MRKFNSYFIFRHLSSVPHLAGTAQDFEVASWVRDRFIEVRRLSPKT